MEMLEMECHAKKIGLLSFRSRWFAIFQVKVTVRANVIFKKDKKKKKAVCIIISVSVSTELLNQVCIHMCKQSGHNLLTINVTL